jgi:hypothetical protein
LVIAGETKASSIVDTLTQQPNEVVPSTDSEAVGGVDDDPIRQTVVWFWSRDQRAMLITMLVT